MTPFFAGFMTGHMIRNAHAPVTANGYNYYFDRENLAGTGYAQCSAPIQDIARDTTPFNTTMTNMTEPNNQTVIEDSNDIFSNVTYSNGEKPREVVWKCADADEICCYMECCPPVNDSFDPGFLVFFGFIVLCVLVLIGKRYMKDKREASLREPNRQPTRHLI